MNVAAHVIALKNAFRQMVVGIFRRAQIRILLDEKKQWMNEWMNEGIYTKVTQSSIEEATHTTTTISHEKLKLNFFLRLFNSIARNGYLPVFVALTFI